MVEPAGLDQWTLTRLSDLSNGDMEAEVPDIETMLASIRDTAMPLYDRGLCCAALGATMKLKPLAAVLRDISIMDSLIEMIGQTSTSDHLALGMSSTDLYNIRVNSCVLLAMIMAGIAGSTAGGGVPGSSAGETKEPEQDIIPMNPAPAPPGKLQQQYAMGAPKSRGSKGKRRGKKNSAADPSSSGGEAGGGGGGGGGGGSRAGSRERRRRQRPATSSQAEGNENVATPSEFRGRGGGGGGGGGGGRGAGSLAESYGSSRREVKGASRGGWGIGSLNSPPGTADSRYRDSEGYDDYDDDDDDNGEWNDSRVGRVTSPTKLYALGTSTVEPLGHEDGGDPKLRRGGREAGLTMSTSGDYTMHVGRVPATSQRAGVLFGSELPNDASVPMADPKDYFEVDRRLGYQVPRTWFPSGRPDTNSRQLTQPPPRPSPLERAKRPHTSDLVRDEHYTQQAYASYTAISEMDGGHPFGSSLLLEEKDSVVSPSSQQRRGRFSRDRSQQQPGGGGGGGGGLQTSHSLSHLHFLDERSPTRQGSTLNNGNGNGHELARDDADLARTQRSRHRQMMHSGSSSRQRAWSPGRGTVRGADEEHAAHHHHNNDEFHDRLSRRGPRRRPASAAESSPTRQPSGSSSSSSSSSSHRYGAKVPTKKPLAGYSYQFKYGATSKKGKRGRQVAWSAESEHGPPSASSAFNDMSLDPSSAAASAQPKRWATNRAPEVDEETGEELPPPPVGSLVMKEDYEHMQAASATSKAAAKAVQESLDEAKAHQKEMRLHSIINADVTAAGMGKGHLLADGSELEAAGQKDHASYMTVLGSELKATVAHKDALEQQMLSAMELQHQALPMRFLFTIPGGASLCRTRLQRAFARWIAEFERAQAVVALALWRIYVDECKFREETEVYHRDAGSAKLTRIIQKMQRALKLRVLTRLRNKTSWLLFEHREACMLRIQSMIRRVRGKQRFLWLHRSQPIGGLLADIDMAECRFLRLQVDPLVRDDKRLFWRTATRLQTQWRAVVTARWWVLLRRMTILLQSLIRMFPARNTFLRMRNAAIVIQCTVKMVLARWPYLRWVVASRLVQRMVRGHVARIAVLEMIYEKRRQLYPRLGPPTKIQCAWRSMLARQVLAALRKHERDLFLSALKLQLAWYRRQGNFSTFVLLGCLREQDEEERDMRKFITRLYRKRHAVNIQREYRVHRVKRREKAASRIQAAYRNFVTHRANELQQMERWAARKLHFWAKGTMRKRHRAARKIHFWWWHAVPGRFLAHLTETMARVEELELEEFYRSRDEAAAAIQAVLHGIYTRRQVRRLISVMKIQRVTRGFMGRRRALGVLRHVQREIASLYVRRLEREMLVKERNRVRRLHAKAATVIQAAARRYIVLTALARAAANMRKQVEVAIMLQNNYRGHRRMTAALKDMTAQRRRFLNPFKELSRVRRVCEQAKAGARAFYDGADELAGMGLSTVLRRLGLDVDVLPALRRAGHHTLQDLEAMDEAALEKAGVVDGRTVNGQWEVTVFNAKEARETLVSFVKLVFTTTPAERASLLRLAPPPSVPSTPTAANDSDKKEAAATESDVDHRQQQQRALVAATGGNNAGEEDKLDMEDGLDGNTTGGENKNKPRLRLQEGGGGDAAASEEDLARAKLLRDFEVLPLEGLKQIAVRMFEEAYTSRFASRSANFAAALDGVDLTPHQMRRFFKMHNTPARAKEHLPDLVRFHEQKEQLEWDEKRLIAACDQLRFGLEQMSDLLAHKDAEGNHLGSGGGGGGGGGGEEDGEEVEDKRLGMHRLLEDCLDMASRANTAAAKASLTERRRQWATRHGAHASLRGPATADPENPMVACVAAMEAAYARLEALDAAAARIIDYWRGFAGRALLAVARHRVAAQRLTAAYLEERTTNHVRRVWEEDRRIEKEEYEASYRQWLLDQEREATEKHLATVMRHGWEEAVKPKDRDGEHFSFGNQADEGTLVFVPVDRSSDPVAQWADARDDMPIYTLEENAAVRVMQRFQRQVSANVYVRALRRDRLRVAKEEEERLNWERKKREREQYVALRFRLRDLDNDMALEELGIEKADDKQYAARCDKELAVLLDSDCELVVGFPVEARYNGGDFYFPGTVYQVNPTQYATSEGMKWYPKGTFGVMYDDGDFEPAVDQSLIRVIKLKIGDSVEARFGGHTAFFAGKVVGENTRDGRVLSYQVEYADKEFEKAVPRSRIRLNSNEMLLFQSRWQARQVKNEGELQRRAVRAKAKWGRLEKQRLDAEHHVQAFDKAWVADHRHDVQKMRLKPSWARQRDPHAQDLLTMVRSSRAVFHELRPTVNVVLKIEYTRLAMGYGWHEMTTATGKAYFLNERTEETSWMRPTFSFEEEQACSRLQSTYRAMMGRRNFRRLIQQESLLGVVHNAIKEAAGLAWIGYGQEGLTLHLWLNRMGANHLVDPVRKHVARQAARQNKHPPSDAETLKALRKVGKVDDLAEFGIEKPPDRRLVFRYKDSHAEKTLEAQRFINYYKGVDDPRSMRECVTGSRAVLHRLLNTKFKANPKRVNTMADALVCSHFPLCHSQMREFLEQMDGKPAMAQDNIGLLVDIPTTHTAAMELQAFKQLRGAAKRIVVLASNLHVALLVRELEAVLEKAEEIRRGGGRRGMLQLESGGEEGKEEEKNAIAGGGAGAMVVQKGGGGEEEEEAEEADIDWDDEALVDDTTSGHVAKAALLLRVEVFEAVKRWWSATIRLQTFARCYVEKNRWRVYIAARESTALLLQCLWRGHQARELGRYLVSQQQSLWEELWSDAENVFYYFHKATGEALWHAPEVPFRPMVRDRFTQRLMQAWPQIEHPEEEALAEKGVCMRCKDDEATRVCNQCEPKRAPFWADGKYHFCFVCFAEEHATSAEMRTHTFTITKQSRAEDLTCVVCSKLATRRCQGPAISRMVFDDLKEKIAAATQLEGMREAMDLPPLRAVKDFVKEYGLPFSDERCAVLHQECGGGPVPTRDQAGFWRALEAVLEETKAECNDTYCADCWKDTHKKGRRAQHHWLGFAAGAPICVMCEVSVAERHCEVCVDDLCTGCAVATHLRGKKHRHNMLPIREPLKNKKQKHCSICDIRAGSEECALCDAPLCDSCLEFKHDEVCPEAHKKADPNKPTKCVVCGRPPDVRCVECGDVYCSVKWMGNPGCFVKVHRKGNRRQHTREPYTHMEDLALAKKLEEKKARALARQAQSAEAERMAEERKRHEDLMAAQTDREERILAEAKRLIEAKKKTKSFFSGKIAAVGKSLFGGGKNKKNNEAPVAPPLAIGGGSPPSSPS